MPSTYTVNLGIEKPATGEQSGTWGDTTNVNFDILDQAINGAERVTLTSAGSSGSPNSLQITNGATSDGRNKWLEFYSSSDLGGSAYVQLDPNDAEKIVFVRNSLAGSQSVILFQGTYNAARDLEVPAGVDMVVKFDGGGASAATVTDVFTKLRATEITTPTLTATTADINGGTLDNSVIGGTTAAAITGTTIVANTSLNIAGDGATVTGIKDEDDMSSNSPTKLATQQSIKAYVDAQVTAQDLDFSGDSGGAQNVDLDSQSLTFTGGTGIDTTGSAQTISFAIDSTVATLADTQTFTNKTLTSAVLNGTISGTSIKDEDNMASDSASHLATQQSIKAYVDTQVATIPVGDITSVVAGTGMTGGGTSGDVTLNVIGGTGITANADEITIDSTVTTLTGTQTLTNKTLTSPTINGGVLSSAVTGTTQAAGTSDTTIATTAFAATAADNAAVALAIALG